MDEYHWSPRGRTPDGGVDIKEPLPISGIGEIWVYLPMAFAASHITEVRIVIRA
jgi:hypothetical protein